MRATTILWIAAAFWLVLVAANAIQTPAHSMMITSGSVIASPAGECRWFYGQKRCFR